MKLGIWLLHKLGNPINTAAVVILGVYTFIWGLWVGNPFWDAFSRADLFTALSSVFPELVWGIFALSVGSIMFYGFIRPSYRTLTRGAWAGFVHWLIIAGGYFAGDWQNTGGITALMIAVYCGFVYLNLRVNRDTLDFEERSRKNWH